MLNRIIKFSIQHNFFVLFFIVLLVIVGIDQSQKLSIDAVPDITNNQVQIITTGQSYSATDIERLVTFPLEQVNNNIPGLVEIRSISRFGLSIITLVFEDDKDIYWARQQVFERINQVKDDIPHDINIPVLSPISTGLGEVYQYTLRPQKGFENIYSLTDLRSIQDWVVRRQLLSVKGIADVSSFGGKLKQYEVAINVEKLKASEITINEVFSAVDNNNQNAGGSYIDDNETALFIKTNGIIQNINELGNTIVKINKNSNILLRDVAEIKYGYAPRYGALAYNDVGETVGGIVLMIKGENSNKVVERIKEKVIKINQLLPKGLVIEPFLDRSKMVNSSISTVKENLLLGALIVIFVLVIFLGNLRAGIIVASIIPLSLLFALILMNIFGLSGNLMSLGALDFGLIIDGSVIIVEYVVHHIYLYKKDTNLPYLTQPEMNNLVQESSNKMMKSSVFGQLIILVVYLPILMLEGIEGKMFRPMALTVIFALLGAFLLTITYVPVASAYFLKKNPSNADNFSTKFFEYITLKFEYILKLVIKHSKFFIIIISILFIYSIIIFIRMGGEFIPTLEEGDFAIELRILPGSNLHTTIEASQRVAHLLLNKFPEIIKIVSKIGNSEIPTDPMPLEAADIMVILKDKKHWSKNISFGELADQMQKALANSPGLNCNVQYPVQMRFNELMTGSKQDIVCKIYGEDFDTLSQIATDISNIIKKIKGPQSLFVEAINKIPQISVEYNKNALSFYGVSIKEVNEVIGSCFAGRKSGVIYEGEKRFDLVVRLEDNLRTNLSDLKKINVPTNIGGQVPLDLLADINIKDAPSVIQRENTRRRVSISFNVRNRDIQSTIDEVADKINENYQLPSGYFIEYGGTFENLKTAKKRLAIAIPISLILILILLYLAFGNITHGLIVYSSIPFSIIGGVLFLHLREMPFSISAGVGFIALFGVSVLNGIVLISEFNNLRKLNSLDLMDAIIKGTKTRIRPVLLTATVAAFGFLPMAFSTNPGSEVQRPLATVVIGGLMISTILTLFILPIIYNYFENFRLKKYRSKYFKFKIKPFVVFVIIILGYKSYGQNYIHLHQLIDSSLKNNLSLKYLKSVSSSKEKLIYSANSLPSTNFRVNLGQNNSSLFDNKIEVSQPFALPKYYLDQKNYLYSDWELAKNNINLSQWELKQDISRNFYYYLLLEEKSKVFNFFDSSFKILNQQLDLQNKVGEIEVISKYETQYKLLEFEQMIKKNEVEKSKALIWLSNISKISEKFLPKADSIIFPFIETLEINYDSLPNLKSIQQEKKLLTNNTIIEKNKLLPEFNITSTLQTFRGGDASNDFLLQPTTDKKVNTFKNYFYSMQFEVYVPLFRKPIKNKIRAAKIIEDNINYKYENDKGEMIQKSKQLIRSLIYFRESINLYNNKVFPNLKILLDLHWKLYNKGEVSTTLFYSKLENFVNTYNEYYKILEEYNNLAIQYHYLKEN